MFCPQCGTESSQELKFCRTCGANLKVIGKAVTLSEAIARSDGIPAKLKDIFSNIKIAHVTEDVSRALDKMKTEIARNADDHRQWIRARASEEWMRARSARKEKTAEQRRERHLTKGFITMFSGVGFAIFLYFLTHALVLNLPADVVAQIPFDLNPIIRVVWLVGLIPALSGFGRVIAGLTIRRASPREIEFAPESPLHIDSATPPISQPSTRPDRHDDESTVVASRQPPDSVTDRTTNILEHKIPAPRWDEETTRSR